MEDTVGTGAKEQAGGRRLTEWQKHVRETMDKESDSKHKKGWFGRVLKTAKRTYRKHKKGGAEAEESESDEEEGKTAPLTTGGKKKKHRRGGKTQKKKRHH